LKTHPPKNKKVCGFGRGVYKKGADKKETSLREIKGGSKVQGFLNLKNLEWVHGEEDTPQKRKKKKKKPEQE